ncbi:hypothetical protein BU17DRAFT_62037 [Hysterangium stoloniferum]|nr:hypothetical protein BU17DRAFT_62037 [Hysterangium stoloniferum]
MTSGQVPQAQYQHYIPRFILRRFQENPLHFKTKAEKKKAYWKAKKKGVSYETVLFYDIATGTLESRPIGKVYGEFNLYQDIKNVEDVNYAEKKLSALESQAAGILTDIHDSLDKGEFCMKRKSLETLRKFLFLMCYRSSSLSLTYLKEDHPENVPIAEWIHRFKEIKGLDSDVETWLHGLRYHLDTPHCISVGQVEALQRKHGVLDLLSMLKLTRENIELETWHALDYCRFADDGFLGLWAAPDGSEFVLGHNSFGLWEGHIAGFPAIHKLYVISPRLMVVWRNNVCTLPPSDVYSDLYHIPMEKDEREYSNFTAPHDSDQFWSAMLKYRMTPQAQEDRFTFKITKLSPSQTYLINAVLLLNAKENGAITFLSAEKMLDTLCSYVCSGDRWVRQDKSKYEPLVRTLLPIHSTVPTLPNPTRDELLQVFVAIGDVLFNTRYDQAYAIYEAVTKTPPLQNSMSLSIQKLSSNIIHRQKCRFKKRLPPRDFQPQPNAKLSPKLSQHDSVQVMKSFKLFVTEPIGIKVEEDKLSELVLDTSFIGFLWWLARNRHDVLDISMENFKLEGRLMI